jgi:hypothetical protein
MQKFWKRNNKNVCQSKAMAAILDFESIRKSTTHVQNSYSNIYGKFSAWKCSGFKKEVKNKKRFTLQTDKLTPDTF